jgi:hypothetical protein
VVRVDVAGRDRVDSQRLGEIAQPSEPLRIATLVRALQLDEEALAPERVSKRGGAVRAPQAEPVPRTAGEADEPVVQLRQQRSVQGRRERIRTLPRTRPRMRRRQQPAEVRVAPSALDEQRHVRAVGQRHLGAGDRPHAEGLRRMRELERAVDTVVIGERERLVAELRRTRRELLRQRRAVEERIG